MEATRESVIHALQYGDGDEKETMPRAEAEALVNKHQGLLDRGIRLGSFTYYVVGEILRAEELTPPPTTQDPL